MARLVIASKEVSVASTQIFSSSTPKLIAITYKARAGNAGAVYVADDQSAEANGFEIKPGLREDRDYHPLSVDSNGIWVFGTSGDRLDYEAVMES